MMPSPVNLLTPMAPPGGAGGAPALADDSGAFGRELQRLTDATGATADGRAPNAQESQEPLAEPKPGARRGSPRVDRAAHRELPAQPAPRAGAKAQAVIEAGAHAGEPPAAADLADRADPVDGAPADPAASADLAAWMTGLMAAQAAPAAEGGARLRAAAPQGGNRLAGVAIEAGPVAGRAATLPLADVAPQSHQANVRAMPASAKDAQPAIPAAAQWAASAARSGLERPDAPAAGVLRGEPMRTPAAPVPANGTDATTALLAGPAALQSSAAAASALLPVPTETTLAAALHSPEFGPALGTQISLLARDGIEHARMHLNPAEMGPIAVQVAVDGSQVRVELVAELGATRQVLEQSLPALAASLRDAGFTLTGGGVFQQQREGAAPGDAHAQAGTPRGMLDADDATPAATTSTRPGRTQGLVDLFA